MRAGCSRTQCVLTQSNRAQCPFYIQRFFLKCLKKTEKFPFLSFLLTFFVISFPVCSVIYDRNINKKMLPKVLFSLFLFFRKKKFFSIFCLFFISIPFKNVAVSRQKNRKNRKKKSEPIRRLCKLRLLFPNPIGNLWDSEWGFSRISTIFL